MDPTVSLQAKISFHWNAFDIIRHCLWHRVCHICSLSWLCYSLDLIRKLWSYQMSLTTFILTFFVNQAYRYCCAIFAYCTHLACVETHYPYYLVWLIFATSIAVFGKRYECGCFSTKFNSLLWYYPNLCILFSLWYTYRCMELRGESKDASTTFIYCWLLIASVTLMGPTRKPLNSSWTV